MSLSFQPSVCIDAVLGDLTVDEALRVVKDAGISAFEFWGWWDKDLSALLRAKQEYELEVAACCTRFIQSR